MTAVVLTPKLRLAEGDEVQTFGKRKMLQESTFSHHKTMQKKIKKIELNLVV
jgi:hypothetical protein